METGIATERVLAYLFGAFVIAIAAGLCWSAKMSGSEWSDAATWVTGAVVLGRAASTAASGYAATAQAKAAASIDAVKRGAAS